MGSQRLHWPDCQSGLRHIRHFTVDTTLVDWAEQTMMEGEFDEAEIETLRDIVSRLGLTNVRAFGLTWEDCETYLSRLGYQVRVEVAEAA